MHRHYKSLSAPYTHRLCVHDNRGRARAAKAPFGTSKHMHTMWHMRLSLTITQCTTFIFLHECVTLYKTTVCLVCVFTVISARKCPLQDKGLSLVPCYSAQAVASLPWNFQMLFPHLPLCCILPHSFSWSRLCYPNKPLSVINVRCSTHVLFLLLDFSEDIINPCFLAHGASRLLTLPWPLLFPWLDTLNSISSFFCSLHISVS